MHIQRLHIKNFRLLEKVDLSIEEGTTVIVGRNNSGKTSLTELFRRLLSDNSPTLRLEDFSLSVHEQFWDAFARVGKDEDEKQIRDALPTIETKLTIRYSKNAPSLGALGNFIIDLDPECTEALIVIRYELQDGKIDAFFADVQLDEGASLDEQRATLLRVMKERIQNFYKACVLAVDPNDSTNQKTMKWEQLRALLQTGFINAQRGLDDTTQRDVNRLGKILEALFNYAGSDSADATERDIVQKLKKAVESTQELIDEDFNSQLEALLPAFSLFGYPGLSDPQLLTETTMDVDRLLRDHTRIHYAGVNGVNLPEAYNGLGVRNLIFILLKLFEFFKAFKKQEAAPGIHLVFIEEPEVHLHPQMQQVFIRELGKIADVFSKQFNEGAPWPVQFVITTHSPHIANEAPYESMRYFLATPVGRTHNGICTTKIKDLRKGFASALEKADQEFLHKYMTLTRCDLLFADKAVLIEGTSERLLLPKMIEKIDEENSAAPNLSSQYISIVEVGGAHAHLFFGLLDFLELRTLIITDLDAARKDHDRLTACKVSEGTHTTNGCIKVWFDDRNIAPSVAIEKSSEEKISGVRRLAYQIPEAEDGPCGRSFEDAFILANTSLFKLTGGSSEEREDDAWNKGKAEKKSDFALRYAIKDTEWTVPRYITEGLLWLAEAVCPPCPRGSASGRQSSVTWEIPPRREKSDD